MTVNIEIVKINFILLFIRCHPFITFMNLFTKEFFVNLNLGETVIIKSIDVKAPRNKIKRGMLRIPSFE